MINNKFSTASLPAGMVGTAYLQTLAAAGGASPYTWSVSLGSLPVGLTLDIVSGNISGTPSAHGTSNFTVQATDSLSANATQALSILINPAPLVITIAALPAGTVGVVYSQTLAATGGVMPYSWSDNGKQTSGGDDADCDQGRCRGGPQCLPEQSFRNA